MALAGLALACCLSPSAEGALLLPSWGRRREQEVERAGKVVFVDEILQMRPGEGMPLLDTLHFDMKSQFGRPKCTGDESVALLQDGAPPDFCVYEGLDYKTRGLNRPFKPNWTFDSYALERIMLGKWLESPLRCKSSGRPPGWCQEHADIVVVPSASMHQFVKLGFQWFSFWTMTYESHQKYWTAIRERHHRSGRTPLIVVHFPFAYDALPAAAFLLALKEQPSSFTDRVVIASLESNLLVEYERHFPPTWTMDPGVALQRRLGNLSGGGPALVPLPYPTPLLHPVQFTKQTVDYNGRARRPIAISADTGSKKGAAIRQQLALLMLRSGGAMVCTDGGPPPCGMKKNLTPWARALHSVFCLEPAGDTLTRAHLYVAVLSGCVPVIFEGGREDFDQSKKTLWAWRTDAPRNGQTSRHFIDYQDFALVFNATEVRTQGTDVIAVLKEILLKDAERVASLQRGLERVAPLMRYAEAGCDGPACKEEDRDAFSNFRDLVLDLA